MCSVCLEARKKSFIWVLSHQRVLMKVNKKKKYIPRQFKYYSIIYLRNFSVCTIHSEIRNTSSIKLKKLTYHVNSKDESWIMSLERPKLLKRKNEFPRPPSIDQNMCRALLCILLYQTRHIVKPKIERRYNKEWYFTFWLKNIWRDMKMIIYFFRCKVFL